MLYLNYSKNSTKRLAMRKIKFQTDHYYHVFNRGVDKRNIFLDKNDYTRFIRSMHSFNQLKPTRSLYFLDNLKRQKGTESLNFRDSVPLIEIITYCLIPNHYHFLLKQITDGGVSEFIKRIATGYTTYFNQKNKRSGVLFQGPFKAVEIRSDGQLQKISCYINGNSEIHNITKATSWTWSSYMDYLNLRKGNLCNKNIILDQFKNIEEYKNLTTTIINDSKQQKEEIKNFLLE